MRKTVKYELPIKMIFMEVLYREMKLVKRSKYLLVNTIANII